MLREEMGPDKKNVKIGFFLHTPFPSSEIYRILPVRDEVLSGVLQCDLIGFHTYDYARHFLSSCSRMLYVDSFQRRVGSWEVIVTRLTRRVVEQRIAYIAQWH